MPASLLMIAIDWYGPFTSVGSARAQCVESGVEEFLYLAISKDAKPRTYVGLSANAFSRLTESHHVLGGLDEGYIDLWVGLISSQSEAGRRPSGGYVSHSAALNVAEHMIAYFFQTTENVKKRSNRPGRSAAMFNRWYHGAAPWTRYSHRGHNEWPDFVEFEAEEKFARMIWFGGNITKLNDEEIESLKLKIPQA